MWRLLQEDGRIITEYNRITENNRNIIFALFSKNTFIYIEPQYLKQFQFEPNCIKLFLSDSFLLL